MRLVRDWYKPHLERIYAKLAANCVHPTAATR